MKRDGGFDIVTLIFYLLGGLTGLAIIHILEELSIL